MIRNSLSGLWVYFLSGSPLTSGMTISWTGFAKGNKEAAIKMVVFGLVIGSLAASFYTKLFMGATVEVNMPDMFKEIAVFIFLPLLDGFIAFLAMSLETLQIIASPGDILTILIPLVLFYLISYILLTIGGRFLFKRENAIAMVFSVAHDQGAITC
jgi:ACR3 family arsenite efflux pump ArsB